MPCSKKNGTGQKNLRGYQESLIKRENQFAIESYGVRIGISSARAELVEEIKNRIEGFLPPELFVWTPFSRAVHKFSVRQNKDAEFVLYKGRTKISSGNERENFLKYFDSRIRLTIAEFAEARVFLHAGVVGWKGRAIILPGRSFHGKTTLVGELAKLGAEYYSDEYAVLDENGLVHPFPKTLSIRGGPDPYRQVEYAVETLGGRRGVEPLPVGLVLLTEFKSGARWRPRILSEGNGVMEMLSHTIPIRYNPKLALKVLNKTANRAIIIKTKRGEAKDFAVKLLRFFENRVI